MTGVACLRKTERTLFRSTQRVPLPNREGALVYWWDMGDTEDGLAAGKKLLISCKIGDYENIMNLLDQIEEMEQADKVRMATTTNSLFGNHALEGLDWRGTVSPLQPWAYRNSTTRMTRPNMHLTSTKCSSYMLGLLLNAVSIGVVCCLQKGNLR